VKTEKLKLFEIKLNPDNPRVIKDDKFKQLVKSIKEFPQMLDIRPIVVNKDNMILGGNMRLRACQEAGLKEVPVIRAESLTEAQQKEFIIKDNSNYGEWDFDKLANEWSDFPLVEWGCEVPQLKDYGKDLTLSDKFQIIIDCENENEQKKFFNELSQQYKCRVLTL